MKTCVTTYSFGAYLNDDRLGILGAVDKTAEMGFTGIELTRGAWTKDLNLDMAKAVRERCEQYHLDMVAYCTGANFLSPDFDGELAHLKREIDFAATLGVTNLRHDVGSFPASKKLSRSYDDALPLLVKGTRLAADYAAEKGIGTMTENHGHFSQDSCRIEKLVNAVAHPNFGVLIDIGNFMSADEDPTKAIGILAPYAKHVHAKDNFVKAGCEIDPGEGWGRSRGGNYIRHTIVGQGDAKVYQSIQILKKAGYDGYISVEFEGMEDNLKGIRISKANLERFINE